MNHGPTTVALVGLAGYGGVYLNALLAGAGRPVVLVAGVDPRRPDRADELERGGVQLFPSLAAMYAAAVVPDLIVLSTPLHLHADQTCAAMGHGSHVLCEKPLAATPADAARMIAARDGSGRRLAVGFQWAYSPGVRRLKRDVVAGRFGQPARFRTRVYWPRAESYYTRNGWGRAGPHGGRANGAGQPGQQRLCPLRAEHAVRGR